MPDSEPDLTKFYSNTPHGNATMTDARAEKISQAKAPFESIELPDEPSPYGGAKRIDTLQMRELPQFLSDRVIQAHKNGRLPKTLDHYIWALGGAGLVDKDTLRTFKGLRAKVTGNYRTDEKVVPEILELISGLQAKKR
jgi:hypothetical protein